MTKVLVSIDPTLLRRIDRAAARGGENRSAFLSRVAAADLDAGRGPGASRSARASLREMDDLFASAEAEDATAAVRAMRDSR